MFLPLDGPAAQAKVAVTATTVIEAKAGGSTFDERKVISIQPIGGNLYMYLGDGSGTPSTSTVQNNGFTLFQNGIYTYEASERQKLYILSVTGSINAVISERA